MRGVSCVRSRGFTFGFRDAPCMHRVLREAHKRSRDIRAAPVLRRYERERCSERVFGSDAVSMTPLRGAALTAVARVAPIKQFFAAMVAGRV